MVKSVVLNTAESLLCTIFTPANKSAISESLSPDKFVTCLCGTTNVWPCLRGNISRNAYQLSPLATRCDGISPAIILLNKVWSLIHSARAWELLSFTEVQVSNCPSAPF